MTSFLRDNHSVIIISIMLLGFKGLVFHRFLPKCSEFSHKVSGYTTLGKIVLGFENQIFPLILDLGYLILKFKVTSPRSVHHVPFYRLISCPAYFSAILLF